jgi:hypothetical protein
MGIKRKESTHFYAYSPDKVVTLLLFYAYIPVMLKLLLVMRLMVIICFVWRSCCFVALVMVKILSPESHFSKGGVSYAYRYCTRLD